MNNRFPGRHLTPFQRSTVRFGRLCGMSFEQAGRLVGCRIHTAARLCGISRTVPADDDATPEQREAGRDRILAALAADVGIVPEGRFADTLMVEAWNTYIRALNNGA